MFVDLPKRYKFHRYLSSGYHGDIYLVYDTVYKILKKFNDIKVGKNETNIITKLNHPNIIKHLEYYEYNNCWFIEMIYYSKGNLYSRLLRNYISKHEYIKWLYQIKNALDYMHKYKITHNDLKLNNILLDNNDNIIIIDFGCALENILDFSNDINSFENIQHKLKNKIKISKL